MPQSTLLDPVTVAELGNLQIRAQRLLDGLYSGSHLNRNRGTSKEFSEHRPYNPGDDLKGLDWKVYARSDRLVVKQYDEETNMMGVVVLDNSASMSFSSEAHLSKFEYARTLAASLAYLFAIQKDSIGLLTSTTTLPPRQYQGSLDHYFKNLENLPCEGRLDLSKIPERVSSLLHRRAFVIFISDLMDDKEKILSTIKILQSRKHEVLVIQLLDPAEKDFPFKNSLLAEDLETGEKLETDADEIREAYRKIVNDHLSFYSHVFRGVGLDYVFLTTDLPFDKGLQSYLSWREGRR